MRQPKQILLLSIVLLLAFAAGANAQVTWTVNGTFNDGGTLSGSFTYDATTNTYSNINVTTTSGSAFAGATYNFTDPYLESAANELILSTTTGGLKDKPVLDLAFFPILTNAGEQPG